MLPNVPITICRTPGRSGAGYFSDPWKTEGVQKAGTETPIPPCKCTKPCIGSFLYFDSLILLTSIFVRRDYLILPPFIMEEIGQSGCVFTHGAVHQEPGTSQLDSPSQPQTAAEALAPRVRHFGQLRPLTPAALRFSICVSLLVSPERSPVTY